MKRYPAAARIMMLATAITAMALFWFGSRQTAYDPDDLPVFVVLTILGTISVLFPIRSPRAQATYLVCNIFVFASVVMLPISWTNLLCVLVWVPSIVQRSRGQDPVFWVPPVVNASQLIVVSNISYWFINLIQRTTHINHLSILWLMLSSIIFVLAQSLHVSILVSLYRKVKWRSSDVFHLDSFIADEVQVLVGILFAVVYKAEPVLLPVIVLLALVAYRLSMGVQAARQAELDPKTGLYNAKYLEIQLAQQVKKALTRQTCLSIVFLDIDFLRDVNNEHGHQTGDAALRLVAKTLQAHANPGSIACRFGGEEFVLLLPEHTKERAVYLAESIRESISISHLQTESGVPAMFTVSCGVASCPLDGGSGDALLKAADSALYAAKSAGRNRVCVANATSDVFQSMGSTAHPAASSAAPKKQAPPAAMGSPAEAVRPKKAPGSTLSMAKALLAIVALSSALVLTWSAATGFEAAMLGGLAVYCFLCALAQRLNVKIYVRDGAPRSVSVSMAVTMAAGANLGTQYAVLVNVVCGLTQVFKMKRRPWNKVVFNLGMAVLSAFVGTRPFDLVMRTSGLLTFEMTGLIALLLGSVGYYLMNVGLMVLYVAWLDGRSPADVWRQSMAWMTPHYFFFTVAGGFLGYFQSVMGLPGTIMLVSLMLIILYIFDKEVEHMHASLRAMDNARIMLSQANQVERDSMSGLVEAISAVIDARDSSVFGHSRQVAKYAMDILREHGETDIDRLEAVRLGALLHDLGKIGTPEYILNKPGRFTPDEYEVIKQHTVLGEHILSEVSKLAQTGSLVGQHHERWDGYGYPRGLAGESIHIGARAIAVADSLDSMLSDRVYARAKSVPAALVEIQRCAGTQFDPAMVEALIRLAQSVPEEYFRSSQTAIHARSRSAEKAHTHELIRTAGQMA